MTAHPCYFRFVVMIDWASDSKKIPLNPPFSKGEGDGRGVWFFPLFEKEGLGEIFYNHKFQRIRP